MCGLSPGASGPVIVAHTVVSVGPYAFTNRRPAAHRSTSPGSTASPAATSDVTDPKAPPGTPVSTAGGTVR